VLLHVVTVKGKGYGPAESDQTTFHGVGVFDPETGTASKGTKKTYTQVFGETAVEIAERVPNVVAVTAAMTDNTGLKPFARKFPERFFDVGMAEEHAVTFSGGLAASGMLPITAIYSTFLQRAYDQIIHDVAVQGVSVVLAVDRAGLVGEDGAPQHGAFDVGYLRMIPGAILMQPKNGEELRDMLWTAVRHRGGPISVRYPRTAIPDEEIPRREPRIIPIGVSEQLRAGGDVAILSLGTMVLPALEAAGLLELQGVSATVVNARFASPVDERAVTELARSVGRLVTVEENVPMGGFGSAVHECLAKQGFSATPMLRIALPEQFVGHGKRDELLKSVGLDAAGIARRTLEWMRVTERLYT
jgi:1-deoxy-D-xylulose-5-phosphate synthase